MFAPPVRAFYLSSMMVKSEAKQSNYIEALASEIADAGPYWSGEVNSSGERKAKAFPTKPGIYLIMRRVNVEEDSYRMKGVNLKSPLVLYVGKTGNLRRRLSQHFGGKDANYQGSQFRKFLFQVCQDHEMVDHILSSKDTVIAYVVIEEGEAVIDIVEKLAMQFFQPRFNIKDR